MPPFENMLTEMIKHEASHDDLAKQLFQDGDAAHLKRWLDDGRADQIWRNLCKGPRGFEYARAAEFVMAGLRFRKIAEGIDAINKKSPTLERGLKRSAPKELKRFKRKLDNSEIPLREYIAHIYRIEASLQQTKIDYPHLSVRSDNRGSRRRTIFCRTLSGALYSATGRWHDSEVGVLCEIAFGGDITIAMVQSARRAIARKKTRISITTSELD